MYIQVNQQLYTQNCLCTYATMCVQVQYSKNLVGKAIVCQYKEPVDKTIDQQCDISSVMTVVSSKDR